MIKENLESKVTLGTIVRAVCQDLNLSPSGTCLACLYFHNSLPHVSWVTESIDDPKTPTSSSSIESASPSIFEVIIACIYLAAKISECPIKLRDCVNSLEYLSWAIKNEERGITNFSVQDFKIDGIESYWLKRDKCLQEEAKILHMLEFKLQPSFLYELLLETLGILHPSHIFSHFLISIINDAVTSPIFSNHPTEIIIVSATLLTCRLEFIFTFREERSKDPCISSSSTENDTKFNLSRTWSNIICGITQRSKIGITKANLSYMIGANEEHCLNLFHKLKHIFLQSYETEENIWKIIETICCEMLNYYSLLQAPLTLPCVLD